MINIAEILKDCSKGTKLYSPTYGWGDFVEIVDGEYIKIGNNIFVVIT